MGGMKDRESIRIELGKEVYRVRRSKGLSQAELASYVELSLSQYRKIEKGRAPVSVERLLFIAQAMNVSIVELLKPFIDNPEVLFTREQIERMQSRLARFIFEIADPHDLRMLESAIGLSDLK